MRFKRQNFFWWRIPLTIWTFFLIDDGLNMFGFSIRPASCFLLQEVRSGSSQQAIPQIAPFRGDNIKHLTNNIYIFYISFFIHFFICTFLPLLFFAHLYEYLHKHCLHMTLENRERRKKIRASCQCSTVLVKTFITHIHLYQCQ